MIKVHFSTTISDDKWDFFFLNIKIPERMFVEPRQIEHG